MGSHTAAGRPGRNRQARVVTYRELGVGVARFLWGDQRTAAAPSMIRPPVSVPAEYLSLHTYLDHRYADTVVLSFRQIEDLLGFALPDPARHQTDWWSTPPGASPSAQSRSWTEAHRTAVPNLGAQNVLFERGLSS